MSTHPQRPPPHPGEVLDEQYLRPRGMTQVECAKHLGIPIQRLNGLIRGRRSVTPETALLLAAEFGTTPQFWMHLQVDVDLWEAAERRAKEGRREQGR